MVRQLAHVHTVEQQSGEQIPPLEPGDRLTRDEFERRYAAMPPGIKAELLEGLVHMPSPTRFRGHGRPHLHLITWLGYYESGTLASRLEITVRLGLTWTMNHSPMPCC